MSRRRFIVDAVFADRAELTGAHAAHLSRVLRAQVGQEFDIAAEGRVRRGRVVHVSADRVEFELGEGVPSEAMLPVTLYLSIIKFDRMEWAIEKCTELGVARIVPVIAARTETHLAAAAVRRVERWQRLALQASEQSRRPAPPEITLPVKLNSKMPPPEGQRIVLAETERTVSLKNVVEPASAISLAIGPEGGWTEEELKLFEAEGWTSASLGPTILRTETAAIVAVAAALICESQ